MASSININAAVDAATAKACHDYEGRRMLKVPERRRAIMRLVVVLIVLAFTVWAVEWIAFNSSGFHYKRVAYNSTEARAYFRPVPAAGSFLDAPRDGMIPNGITCPCLGQPSLSWCNFIHFYLIQCNQKTNYQPQATVISTASDDLCERRPANISLACNAASDALSCSNALDAVYDFPDTKTYIQTSNLASPFQVYDLVSTNMLSNIRINNQTIFNQLKSTNSSNYDHSILVLSLVQSMVAQVFNCNTVSTLQEFWDRGNQCGWNLYPQIAAQFNDNKFVFGMTIDYEAYSTRCRPSDCYILVKDNFHTRLMRALGEVGGVASLILLGIQMVIWPLVAKICRFPRAPNVQVGSFIGNLPTD